MAVNHVRRGRGEPLVLLHGLGSRWQVWEPVLDDLTRRYEVIALDLPGFGASPPSGAATVAEFADEVAGFVAGLGLERPAYGGSSLGGGIALELGSRGSARAVTVFSPVGFFGRSGAAWCRTVTGAARSAASCLSPALPALMATAAGRIALCGTFYGHPAHLGAAGCVDDARALAAAPGFGAGRRAIGQWRLDRCPPGLGRIPVTVAWGTRDVVLPYHQSARARRVLPHARHVRLAGCGHLPFADEPRGCAGLFLDR